MVKTFPLDVRNSKPLYLTRSFFINGLPPPLPPRAPPNAQRKYSEAEPLLLGAVAVLPYSLPPGHARSLAAHRRLAEVLEARGK